MSDLTTASNGDIVEYSQTQIDLIKNSYAKGVTDEELRLFVGVSKRLGLDIFARQIHAVKRWDSKTRREIMTIQVGVDGYRAVAERTGKYAGCSLPTFETDEKGNIISCSITVKKIVEGHVCEFSAIAYMEEYMPKNGNPMWSSRPRGMLSKCATSLALRSAFPLELSGIYTEEEVAKDFGHQDDIDEACKRSSEMDYKSQPEQIKRLEEACGIATKGMTKVQKVKWLKDNIKCQWGDLGKKTKQELDDLINIAEKNKPIESETITTEDTPFN